jgi:HAE1 family hydrophobic/amphiphilic exporter-1
MALTRLAITRPLAILMLIVSLVLMGAVSFTRMKVDRFPNISFPAVFVSIGYTGAAPSDMEELVTKPVENVLSGLPGIDTISSTSAEGISRINVRFVEGTDTNQAALDVDRKISSVRRRLPTDIDAPSITKADISAIPVMNIALSSTKGRSLSELYDIGNDTVLPRLQSVDGVADVQLVGGLQREIQVQIKPDSLRAYGISLTTVQTALQRENVSTPSGRLDEGQASQSVRAQAAIRTPEDLKRLIVVGPGTTGAGANGATATTNGRIIRLQDVAQVVDGYANQTRIQRFNGKEAVGFILTKQADANSIQAADNIKAAVASLQRALPADVTMTITSDSSIFTRHSLDSVIFDLQLAVVLTGVVLLLFLHLWRNTFIVLLAIPTSLISTFLVMYFLGFSLNIITLLALALTIGILVDDSIVVIENISRHLEEGEEPRSAALRGRSEIGLAAIAITMVDVVVYLPVSFMSGNTGRLFKEFGITIAAATLFSLLVSFALTPMLASRWLNTQHGAPTGPLARFGVFWDRGYDRIAAGYQWLLARALGLRWLVVGLSASMVVGVILMLQANVIGSEYAPPEDDGNFQVNVTMPPGTSLAGTDAVAKRVEAALAKIPEVQNIFSSVGGGGFGSGSRSSQMAVQLVDRKSRERSVFQVLGDVRRIARGIPDAQIRASVSNPLAGGGGGSMQVRVQGDDFDKLNTVAMQIEDVVKGVEGAVDVQDNGQQRDPEYRALVDRERLADLGLNATQVSDMMKMMVGGVVVTQMRPEVGNQVDIRVISDPSVRVKPDELGALPIVTTAGTAVRLDQVAKLMKATGPAQIQRTNRQRVIEVTANVTGRSLGDITRDVRAGTNLIPLPEGYQIVYGGQVQQQEQAFATLFGALVLSILLVYMLMVALFESWLTPLAIMFSLPVALVGGFMGLYVSNNTFNIFSLIGTIMLMGLAGKNAILLVDFTNNLRKQAAEKRHELVLEPAELRRLEVKERKEAILQAGFIRLRPILMTTATIIFAMVPLALKLEEGGESRSPLAVVIIGGVLSSTLLTLVLVPSVYTILDDVKMGMASFRQWLRSLGRGRAATAARPVPVVRAAAVPPPVRGGAED